MRAAPGLHTLTLCTGQEYEARLSKTLLARVTKEAVEAQARLLHPGSSCVIKVRQ